MTPVVLFHSVMGLRPVELEMADAKGCRARWVDARPLQRAARKHDRGRHEVKGRDWVGSHH
jgi:hypothetical protein